MKVIDYDILSRIPDIREDYVNKKIIISVINSYPDSSNYISYAIKRQRFSRRDCITFRGINMSSSDSELYNWEDCEGINILDAMRLEYSRYSDHLTYYVVENMNDFQMIVKQLNLIYYKCLYQELCKLAYKRFKR